MNKKFVVLETLMQLSLQNDIRLVSKKFCSKYIKQMLPKDEFNKSNGH